MTLIFVVLVVIASLVLGLIVLIQNPKGGGLTGSIAGFNTQFMGVKQTTDVLEKGTWIFAAIIGILCLASTLFISKTTVVDRDKIDKVGGALPPQSQPANTTPFQPAPTPQNP
jgi:preprotein translocase subunit SecG